MRNKRFNEKYFMVQFEADFYVFRREEYFNLCNLDPGI